MTSKSRWVRKNIYLYISIFYFVRQGKTEHCVTLVLTVLGQSQARLRPVFKSNISTFLFYYLQQKATEMIKCFILDVISCPQTAIK